MDHTTPDIHIICKFLPKIKIYIVLHFLSRYAAHCYLKFHFQSSHLVWVEVKLKNKVWWRYIETGGEIASVVKVVLDCSWDNQGRQAGRDITLASYGCRQKLYPSIRFLCLLKTLVIISSYTAQYFIVLLIFLYFSQLIEALPISLTKPAETQTAKIKSNVFLFWKMPKLIWRLDMQWLQVRHCNVSVSLAGRGERRGIRWWLPTGQPPPWPGLQRCTNNTPTQKEENTNPCSFNKTFQGS